MRPDQQAAALDTLVEAALATPNGEVAEITEAIAQYERDHDLTTEHMIQALRAGHMTEGPQITAWLMLARRRELLISHEAKSA
jgi:hypothetical protein